MPDLEAPGRRIHSEAAAPAGPRVGGAASSGARRYLARVAELPAGGPFELALGALRKGIPHADSHAVPRAVHGIPTGPAARRVDPAWPERVAGADRCPRCSARGSAVARALRGTVLGGALGAARAAPSWHAACQEDRS